MKPEEDERLGQLLLQGQAGDKDAYSKFLRDASEHLEGYLARKMSGSELASDVLQDALIAIHRSRQTYLPGRSLAAWLYTICEHRMIDHYRKFRRLEKAETPLPDGFAERFPAPSSETEDERLTLVESALSRLPEKQRRVIELLKLQGLSVREVALQTGMTESAVKVTAFRGYEAVRREVGVRKL